MNILVLGGDGFLGSHLVDKINLEKHNVTVFDRFRYNKSMNLEHLRHKINLVAGEFSNKEHLLGALKKQDIVYHFISTTSPSNSWNAPIVEVEENLKNSIQLFALAAELEIKKVVFTSSGGTVYGLCNDAIACENSLPKPFAPYAITKLAIEHFLYHFHIKTKLAYDVYRIANLYGIRQPMNTNQGVVAIWMDMILRGQEINVYGDDKTIRDYIYAEDVALLITNSINDIQSSGTYNVGSNKGTSILELLECFKEIVDIPFTYRLYERRSFDNPAFTLNSSKIYSKFGGFSPTPIKDGLTKTWNYFKDKTNPDLV